MQLPYVFDEIPVSREELAGHFLQTLLTKPKSMPEHEHSPFLSLD